MADHTLPDDPRDWPADPFALLGVPPGSAEADVKRAYTRLIRRFKPEHHPDQFRRIRDAYEACLRRTHWYRIEPEPDEPIRLPAEPEQPPPRPEPVADPIDQLWGLAADGRAGEAYAGLVEQAQVQADRSDVPLRLYWLLALDPALDPARTRHDWLADALVRSRLRGPAAELYRRELDADPDVTLYGPYGDLLASPADAADLLAVARWRVTVAGRTCRYHHLAADLRAVRDRLADRDESGWLALLVAAADWAVWDTPAELGQLVRAELSGLKHLELRHGYAFDRLDESQAAAALGRDAVGCDVAHELVAAVRAAWAGYGTVRPDQVEAAAADVADEPVEDLARFDRVLQTIGPGFLILAARMFERYLREAAAEGEPEFPPGLLRGLARRLSPRRLADYGRVRSDLLALLTAEAVDPLELAAACDDDPDDRFRSLAGHLRADLSLRVVWLAARVHRG